MRVSQETFWHKNSPSLRVMPPTLCESLSNIIMVGKELVWYVSSLIHSTRPLLYHLLAHFKKKASASHSKPHPPDEAGSLNLQSSHHPSNHSYDNLHSPQCKYSVCTLPPLPPFSLSYVSLPPPSPCSSRYPTFTTICDITRNQIDSLKHLLIHPHI